MAVLHTHKPPFVALFTRAWIEILRLLLFACFLLVALFTRAWIEIYRFDIISTMKRGRPLYEGVD